MFQWCQDNYGFIWSGVLNWGALLEATRMVLKANGKTAQSTKVPLN